MGILSPGCRGCAVQGALPLLHCGRLGGLGRGPAMLEVVRHPSDRAGAAARPGAADHAVVGIGLHPRAPHASGVAGAAGQTLSRADLGDSGGTVIAPLLLQPARRGPRRRTHVREVVNAIRHLAHTGCGWRLLPHDFHPGRPCADGSVAACAGCCPARSTISR